MLNISSSRPSQGFADTRGTTTEVTQWKSDPISGAQTSWRAFSFRKQSTNIDFSNWNLSLHGCEAVDQKTKRSPLYQGCWEETSESNNNVATLKEHVAPKNLVTEQLLDWNFNYEKKKRNPVYPINWLTVRLSSIISSTCGRSSARCVWPSRFQYINKNAPHLSLSRVSDAINVE